jgi:hypothetical protein
VPTLVKFVNQNESREYSFRVQNITENLLFVKGTDNQFSELFSNDRAVGMIISLVERKIPLEKEKVCDVTGKNPLKNYTIKSHGKFSDRLTVCFSVKLRETIRFMTCQTS